MEYLTLVVSAIQSDYYHQVLLYGAVAIGMLMSRVASYKEWATERNEQQKVQS